MTNLKILKFKNIHNLSQTIRTNIFSTKIQNIKYSVSPLNLIYFRYFSTKEEMIKSLEQRPFSENWKTSLSYLEQVLIGILLGDGHLEKSSKGVLAQSRLRITFAGKYKGLANNIAGIFSEHLTSKGIRYSEIKNRDSTELYQIISLTTKVSPLFEFYHKLFYVNLSNLTTTNLDSIKYLKENTDKNVKNIQNKYIKIIPSNIEELLTPVVLAFFICGDGNYHKTKQIIRLCTNSYSKKEVELLAKALYNKFNLESRLEHVRNNQFILIIRKNQVPIIQNLVKDHIHPSMLYRIGLNI